MHEGSEAIGVLPPPGFQLTVVQVQNFHRKSGDIGIKVQHMHQKKVNINHHTIG